MAESTETTVQSPINCQFCTEKAIKYKCFDCKTLLCPDCNTKIHRLESAKGHKIVTIDSFDQEIDFANIQCRKHHKNYCCLFCNVCGVLVCPSCIAKDHAKHEMIEIQESYNAKIKQLKSRRARFEKEKDNVNPALSKLKDMKLQVLEKFDSVDSAIMEHGKRLHQKLENFIEHFRGELASKKKSNVDLIESEMKKFLAYTEKVDNVLMKTNRVTELKDATKFFDDAKSIMNSIDVSQPQSNPINIGVPRFISGDFSKSHVGRLEETVNDIKLEIVNKYETDMTMVSCISPCSDGSLWIGYNLDDKIQRVQTDGDKLKVLTSVDTKVYGMNLSSDNNLFVCSVGKIVKKINKDTGKVNDTVYNIDPFLPTSIHISSDKRIVIGGNSSKQGRRVVIVMNEMGDQERVYENDESGVPLFTYPYSITSTSNNCLHVADYKPGDDKGRMVVLGQGGQVVNTYSGHPVINKDKQFKPGCIVTTPTDNVIVVDRDTQTLHVLDNTGHFLRYFNTKDVGIYGPFSLAYTSTGQLYIGCTKPESSQKKEAKLYLVDISGC